MTRRRTIRGFFAVWLAAAGAVTAADWPMFRGGPALRGVAPGSLADRLQLLWRFKTKDAIRSSAAIGGGRVYVGSDDGGLYALDARTGKQTWVFRTDDTVESSPLLLDGAVYIGASDGFVYKLNAAGKVQWKYETGDKILAGVNWAPAAQGGGKWILVGSYDSRVHCLDASTGEVVWTYQSESYVNGAPAVDAGRVVFGGCDAAIHTVSLKDGKKITSIDTGSYIAASAALVGKLAFVGHYGNEFVCADTSAGKIVWTYKDKDEPFFASAAVTDDRVVVGSRDKRVHCLRRDTGKPVWTFRTRGNVDSSPVVVGGKVVVGSDDGRLYILRLDDGRRVWSFEVGQPIIASPAVSDGMVVVGSEDGNVYTFGPGK
jgi:outer membrane protein assembly factor BamB